MIARALSLIVSLSLLAVSVAPAMTAASDHIGAAPVLLGLDKVRTELHLNSLQKAVLNSLREEYKTSARKLTDPLPASPAERAVADKKLEELKVRYNRRALSVLNDSQRKRFLELEHQILGGTALYAPKVQKRLALTDKQIAKVEKLRQDGLRYVGKVNQRFEDGKIGYQERIALLRSRRQSQSAELLKVLTPEQLKAFETLGGKKASL